MTHVSTLPEYVLTGYYCHVADESWKYAGILAPIQKSALKLTPTHTHTPAHTHTHTHPHAHTHVSICRKKPWSKQLFQFCPNSEALIYVYIAGVHTEVPALRIALIRRFTPEGPEGPFAHHQECNRKMGRRRRRAGGTDCISDSLAFVFRQTSRQLIKRLCLYPMQLDEMKGTKSMDRRSHIADILYITCSAMKAAN